jgi:endonuclease/exonuclease/phosphatase family metal-dependent hydrolase
MNRYRSWNILDWNIRGINSQDRWDDLANKISESNCNIICLQETKRESFDNAYIRKFCPRKFNMFAYHPSVGNSGGIITIWNGNALTGNIISSSSYQVTVEFTCNISGEKWYITNIYASCHAEGRYEFIHWMNNLDSSIYELWMLVGDFNMIRSNYDRNRPGGNSNTMLAFNDIIQAHDLEEIPLKGRQYTWSNMQNTPLLEKLDWIFTSSMWTITFPNTMAYPMARLGSDHVPILIEIGSVIPKAQIFRFEEYWLDFDGLDEVV